MKLLEKKSKIDLVGRSARDGYIHTHTRMYVPTYIHTYIHTHTHTHIHMNTKRCTNNSNFLFNKNKFTNSINYLNINCSRVPRTKKSNNIMKDLNIFITY
jgi:hypothetical protein